MTKKKKIFIGMGVTFACLTVALVPAITIPLVLNNQKNNINDKLIDSYKNLFVDGAEEKINNLFFSKNKLNQNITKDEIRESISFDKDTFLYKEVKKYNQNLDEINDELVNEIYDMYLDEINSGNQRCGSIFKKHFWTAIYMKGRALVINALSLVWWGVQIAPAIVAFVGNLDGAALADALASFSFRLPDFLRPFLEDTIKTIKKFKINTKCKWIFYIWTQGVYI